MVEVADRWEKKSLNLRSLSNLDLMLQFTTSSSKNKQSVINLVEEKRTLCSYHKTRTNC